MIYHKYGRYLNNRCANILPYCFLILFWGKNRKSSYCFTDLIKTIQNCVKKGHEWKKIMDQYQIWIWLSQICWFSWFHLDYFIKSWRWRLLKTKQQQICSFGSMNTDRWRSFSSVFQYLGTSFLNYFQSFVLSFTLTLSG